MAEWLEYMTAEGNPPWPSCAARTPRQALPRALLRRGQRDLGLRRQYAPEFYADLFRQAATFLKAPRTTAPSSSPAAAPACRPRDRCAQQERGCRCQRHQPPRVHPALRQLGRQEGLGRRLPESEWVSTLGKAQQIDQMIVKNIEVLDKNDPAKKIGFYFDEWGSWYDPEPGSNPGFLVQRNTLRDAPLAALHFNVFHAHAERVKMTNIAQMVNVLQAMILTTKDKMVLTPTYHAFAMYIPFQDATSLPATLEGNPVYKVDKYEMPTVSATAARGKDGKLYLGLVNAHAHDAQTLSVDLGQAGAGRSRPAADRRQDGLGERDRQIGPGRAQGLRGPGHQRPAQADPARQVHGGCRGRVSPAQPVVQALMRRSTSRWAGPGPGGRPLPAYCLPQRPAPRPCR